MKKYSITLSLIAILTSTIFFNLKLNDIKYVKGSRIQKINYRPVINVTGEFESNDKTHIMFSLPICIKDVYVKENSYVNKGQALFSIDKEKMASIITNGLSEDVISFIETSDLNQLKSRINNISETNIFNLPDTVYATENGIVSSLTVFSGGFALPNQHIMIINHTDDIQAKFSLSQIDYGKISIGDPVEIKTVAFEDKTYIGNITEQNAVIKKQNTVVGNKTFVDVYASINNVDIFVADGLQISGVVFCGEEQNIDTLDYSYIYQDEMGQHVFVFDQGRAVKKYIETGIETNEYIQVLTHFSDNTIFLFGDINDGDRVVIEE